MAVYQKQIADSLNLSVITVSRALRGHPDLAQSTKDRVLKKARELGYKKLTDKSGEPTPAGLTTGIRRVGIIICEAESSPKVQVLKSEVLRRIFLSIQRECQHLGTETLIETITTGSSIQPPLLIKNRTVQGVFLLGRYSADMLNLLEGLPAITVSSFIDATGLPRVVADNFHGMRLSTEHLINQGHRRVLFIGDIQANTQIFRERSFGYLAAMQSHGLSSSVIFMRREHDPVPLAEIAKHSAVVCSNDTLAYLIQEHLLAAGIKLPDACSIVSFDHLSDTNRQQTITSYGPDWELMGRVAAGALLSPQFDIFKRDIMITVPGKLFIRDSVLPALA